jgi:hypothetical protein
MYFSIFLAFGLGVILVSSTPVDPESLLAEVGLHDAGVLPIDV